MELLHPECRLVMHAGDGGPAGIDGSFDAMMLQGLHGMAGSEGGILSHSFMPFLQNVWLNDLRIGEIALNMLSFGEHGVPTVMVTGDQAAVDEARALVPGIELVAVKWGLEEKHRLGALSVRSAVSLSPVKTRNLIRDAAKRVMGQIGTIDPFTMALPYVMRVEYTESKYAEAAAMNAGVQRIDENTVAQTRGRFQELVL